jgi:hypothetical protein
MARAAVLAVVAALLALVAIAARAGSSEPIPAVPGTAPAVPGTALMLPGGGGQVLLAPGATFAFVTAEAPRLTRQLGPVALGALDLALGRRADGVAVTGEAPPGLPPAGWPQAVGAGARSGPAPLAAAVDGEDCACATALGTVGERRIAALWATTSFELPATAAEPAVLDVRARYRDGIALWLNGVEIARRSLPVDAAPTALADRPHGPEWETFHVPVVPGLLRRGANQVSVQVQTAQASSAPVLDLEIIGHQGARIVRGPMVQRVGRDRATIVFEADRPVRGALEVGPTPSLGRRLSSGFLRQRRHVFELTGLAPGRIHYRALADGGAGPVRSFHTAPGPGDVVRIAVYGDVRGGHQVHAELIGAILAEAPDLVLSTGDLVLRGSDEADWQRFFAVTGDLLAEVPLYTAVGNHDLGQSGDLKRSALELFAMTAPDHAPDRTFYSVDVGDVHVAMLDSNAYQRRDQLAWIDEDLAAARRRGARAILVIVHDGPFSRGTHGGNQVAVRDYVPVLTRHATTVLFSGHDHLYQRGRNHGLDYVVTGGGGAPLYPITCGVPGRPRCGKDVDDGMIVAAREHHYVMVTVYPDWLELCPRRPDRTALEPCVRYPLVAGSPPASP